MSKPEQKVYRITLRYPLRHGQNIAKSWKYSSRDAYNRFFEYHKRYGVYPSLAAGEVELTGESLEDGKWKTVEIWKNP
jgi:hypothetical protein